MVHRKKTMKIPYSKENPGAKAVLLSGPPGIGKSTVAGVVARAQGYDILELNASDTRSKKTLKEELGDVLDNSVLFMKHDKKGDHGRCHPPPEPRNLSTVSLTSYRLPDASVAPRSHGSEQACGDHGRGGRHVGQRPRRHAGAHPPHQDLQGPHHLHL